MTREEAIGWLKDIKETGCETMFRDWSYEVALDLAIESLSAEPKAIVNNCDLISRADAIEIIASHDETNGVEKVFTGREITDLLATLPSADAISIAEVNEICFDCEKETNEKLQHIKERADRPKGEWIDREDSADAFFLYKYECSVCGGKNVFNSSYCPNCGAHMR